MARIAGLAALFACASVVTAAPAVADEQTYLEVLDMMGVPVADPAAAVEMGLAACAGLDAGQPVTAVAETIGTASGLTPEQSGMVIGVSVAAFCDHHRALVDS